MINNSNLTFDAVIIGGGFYGCMLALHLRKYFNKVLLVEKEEDILTKASYNNQARVHNGYHYPRSFITALRSHENYKKFAREFKKSIDDSFLMTYAIAKNNSKTTAQQFVKFCKQIDIPIASATSRIKKLFNDVLIEEIFLVEEMVFNAVNVRKQLKEKLRELKVNVMLGEESVAVHRTTKGTLAIQFKSGKTVTGKTVYNCAYSQINTILKNSKLPLIEFKHELTEMPLIKMPDMLKKFGVTIMDGPFFSIMPFPDRKLHTIHHVRYTPHESWFGVGTLRKKLKPKSKFPFMIKDAQRYMPILKEVKYVDSLYETKTILLQDEVSDRRPILYKKDYGYKNFHIVMGGKIDNIYDILDEVD
ncbi:MAG: hypothetical protein A3D74_00690 [Candidatus Levybacteria bacterium RIFCSPHIGHO2_02_FULL_37_13]|nr:MAG: hypothetical protein A3D74_00690 [Candidatus Levybacteria bacterium RIFCSPHIGHO2_02_FULL_37_13]OGH30732.1 MAG: hypothetical protein A3E40_00720 [Candidatus Levybacteria bacterium RIFCSPHIGHO2_12_FULL_37_9]OGH37937.1 MAG: hypothetical protein A3B41_04985 [Candidatus Levybacteria bacterium RIFCSPLOWO2_01_FULL_37_26]